MPNLKDIIKKTKDTFTEPWDIKDWIWSSGTTAIVALIQVIIAMTYGISFIIHGVTDPAGPLIYFVSPITIEMWGLLIVLSLFVFIIGIFVRRALPITVGTLFCASVFVGISIFSGIGVIGLGDGWRFAVPLFGIAGTWLVFFSLQLKRMRPNGD